MQTHCGQDLNLHVVLISTGSHREPMSTIPSPRVPEGNYSPVWMLPADNIYHIETHYPNYRHDSSARKNNVLQYGESMLCYLALCI